MGRKRWFEDEPLINYPNRKVGVVGARRCTREDGVVGARRCTREDKEKCINTVKLRGNKHVEKKEKTAGGNI